MANETETSDYLSTQKVGNLEDEALKRKERLKALKRGNLKTTMIQSSAENGADDTDENTLLSHFPKPIFRNYTPKDEILKPGV